MSRLSKPAMSPSPQATPTAAGDSGFARAYPALTEFLSMPFWSDGTPRVLGTMMVLFEEGRWRAWVNCKASSRSAWLSAVTVEALLASVEAGLEGDSLEWRRARPERARPGKRD